MHLVVWKDKQNNSTTSEVKAKDKNSKYKIFFCITDTKNLSGISLPVGEGGSFEGRVDLARSGVDIFFGLVDQGYNGDVKRGLDSIREAHHESDLFVYEWLY